MTPERWRQVKEVVEAAWERDASERGVFLDQACAGDPELRSEVEVLLASDENAGEFLVAPAAELAQPSATQASGDYWAGRRLGPYQVLREIGHGGMGTVYLAERADGQYRKQVAIKVVSPHLGTDEVLRRFRNERQVEASLDHPNIARLLDGGTTEEGLPYLVMEYVEGIRIDKWCDSRKLPVRDRLKLFRQVCGAVQSAHERDIIHRDLKPGNILVTAEGTPKLLDFGIAKVLNRDLSDGAETTIGMGPMTPEYASPEQVRGERVGPASDTYALGVVLYQLLTGQLPYSVHGGDLRSMARVICEQEPIKPSIAIQRTGREDAACREATSEARSETPTGLRRRLAGDLDKIVLKALRKEPERRYTSVAQFSEDLGRFLQDLPVQAREESLAYRCRKFLKRNRVAGVAVAVTAVIVLVLVTGVQQFGQSSGGAAAVKARRRVSNGPSPLRWEDLKFEKIATLGDPAPGGGSYVNNFEPYGLNSRGDLTFAADLPTGGEGAFLLPKNGGLLPFALVRPGHAAPGGGTFEGATLGHISMNNSGDIAFVFGLKPFNAPALKGFVKAGLYRYSHGDRTVTPLVVPGVTAAPGFGTFESTGQHAAINTAGDIVFPGVVRTMQGVAPANGLGQGIFLADRDGHVTKVAAPGDPAPGGSQFDFAMNPWINDRGDIAFGAHVAGEECISISPGCMESVYFKSGVTGKIESIAHQGGQAANGNFYRGAWGPAVNNSGDLVFMGELTPPQGLASARGIYLHSHGVTALIARPGDIMPDGRKILTVNPVSSAGNYSLNNRGEVTFNAALEDGESGLYVHSRDAVHLVAGTGTVIPGIGTVSNVAGLIGGILNDASQVFFWATLKDGRGVLLLATPPPVVSNSKR